MNKKQAVVNNIRIATPCSVDWDEMKGDDRVRFCQSCKLNVYDFSEMSSREIVDLIAEKEGGRVCAQLYRRKDGTVITRDCPVAVMRVKKAYKRSVACVLSIVAGLGFSMPGWADDNSYQRLGGAIAVDPIESAPSVLPVERGKCIMPAVVKEKEPEPLNQILPWVLVATIFGSLLALWKKRKSMWIIGTTMAALFAVLGYVWSTGM